MHELDTPNCPECFHSMEPVVSAWWCSRCGIALSLEGDLRDDREAWDSVLSGGRLVREEEARVCVTRMSISCGGMRLMR